MTDGKPRLEGFAEREVEWRGTRLRYAVGGDGPPLVLVHGLGGTIENWRALAPPLAARHRVLVPDLPGHGRSALLPEARDVDALAEAVLADRRRGGDSRRRVDRPLARRRRRAPRRGAAARGGARARPRRGGRDRLASRAAQVTLAVLGAARPGKPDRAAPPRLGAARGSAGGPRSAGGASPIPTGSSPSSPRRSSSAPPITPTRARPAGRSSPRTRGPSSTASTCPCLCLWGASDNWVRLEDGMEYARRLRAPLRTIAGCGHLLIGERPDACLAAIQEFVASLGYAAAPRTGSRPLPPPPPRPSRRGPPPRNSTRRATTSIALRRLPSSSHERTSAARRRRPAVPCRGTRRTAPPAGPTPTRSRSPRRRPGSRGRPRARSSRPSCFRPDLAQLDLGREVADQRHHVHVRLEGRRKAVTAGSRLNS